MRKYAILALGNVVVAAILVATASATRSATPVLTGTVGPGFTINLKQGSKVVKTLEAGTYTFVIHDKSSIHGWSLDGPHGFAKDLSPVPGTGTKTVTLKLKAGGYKFYCPAHESEMFGHFKAK
jgi:hypothetical protein